MKTWRVLLARLSGRTRQSRIVKDQAEQSRGPSAGALARLEPQADPDPVELALREVETGALEVYAAGGLPVAPGHYCKAPNAAEWSFLAAEMSPAARFDLALSQPVEEGWLYASLQDLGARSPRSDLRAASRLLNEIAEIRKARRESGLTQDHLMAAMELGGAWRALRDAQAVRSSRLNLTAPEQGEAATRLKLTPDRPPAPVEPSTPPPSTPTAKRRRVRRDKSAKSR